MAINHPKLAIDRLFVNHGSAGRTSAFAGYLPLLLYWLTLAAVADWLIGRTLTRLAIFMPKPPSVLVIYQLFILTGRLAAVLTGLLTIGMLIWIAWHEQQTRRVIWLPLVLLTQTGLSLVFLFVAPTGWWPVIHLGLSLSVIGLILGFTIYNLHEQNNFWSPGHKKMVVTLLLPALALLLSKLYQTLPALYAAAQWAGPPPLTEIFFNLGELCVVLSAVGLWYVYGRGASRQTWLVAAVPALVFSVMYLVNPAITGILAIWSIGLSLYLPWPLYSTSLWLLGVTVIVSLRRKELVGWTILLLAAGGYAPQLSTQTFLGLIALWLLTQPLLLPTERL